MVRERRKCEREKFGKKLQITKKVKDFGTGRLYDNRNAAQEEAGMEMERSTVQEEVGMEMERSAMQEENGMDMERSTVQEEAGMDMENKEMQERRWKMEVALKDLDKGKEDLWYTVPDSVREFCDDKEFILKALKITGKCWSWLVKDLEPDLEFAGEVVRIHGYLLEELPEEFQENEELKKLAAKRDAQEKREIWEKHNIRHFAHFTYCLNLDTILRDGLRTRESLEKSRSYYCATDPERRDGVKDSISLSVSFPNHRMFYAKRKARPLSYCVLLIKREALMDQDLLYFGTNAAYHGYGDREDRLRHTTARDLGYIFCEEPWWKSDRELPGLDREKRKLREDYARDSQAEVMCLSGIPVEAIECCIFDSEERKNKYEAMLREKGISAVVDPWYFGGGPYVAA